MAFGKVEHGAEVLSKAYPLASSSSQAKTRLLSTLKTAFFRMILVKSSSRTSQPLSVPSIPRGKPCIYTMKKLGETTTTSSVGTVQSWKDRPRSMRRFYGKKRIKTNEAADDEYEDDEDAEELKRRRNGDDFDGVELEMPPDDADSRRYDDDDNSGDQDNTDDDGEPGGDPDDDGSGEDNPDDGEGDGNNTDPDDGADPDDEDSFSQEPIIPDDADEIGAGGSDQDGQEDDGLNEPSGQYSLSDEDVDRIATAVASKLLSTAGQQQTQNLGDGDASGKVGKSPTVKEHLEVLRRARSAGSGDSSSAMRLVESPKEAQAPTSRVSPEYAAEAARKLLEGAMPAPRTTQGNSWMVAARFNSK